MPNIHVKLTVSGKVQGVFFRKSAKQQADNLKLGGWVRNKKDGTVEISVAGDEKSIKTFTKWCEKGPPFAKVDRVDVENRALEDYDEFSIVD